MCCGLASGANRLRFFRLKVFGLPGQGPALRTASPSRVAAGLPLPRRPGLSRHLFTPGLTPSRGSGSRVSRIPGFVFPLGSRPFDHRRDLLCQHGQVSVIEGLDVRVRRGPLHTDGGPASLDGHDHLQVLRLTGLFPGVIGITPLTTGFDGKGPRQMPNKGAGSCETSGECFPCDSGWNMTSSRPCFGPLIIDSPTFYLLPAPGPRSGKKFAIQSAQVYARLL